MPNLTASDPRQTTPPPKLYISHDADFDWLEASEFGTVTDGQPDMNWQQVSGELRFLRDSPNGRTIGFQIIEFSSFDPDSEENAELRGEPLFDAPQLGLSGVSIAEIAIAARVHFDDRDSLNRMLFGLAVNAKGEEAVCLWYQALEAGDLMAHFALGYTLYELGHFRESYRHLRYYTEIAPADPWNWCWFGKSAEAIGEIKEARRAYKRAIKLEDEEESDETEASELLEALDQDRRRTA